ncbi:sensor histidine kinase [Clostridium sp. ZS2-4]|uniref:sensor histidine kinase n=1 Tax=Clostridium sp. ZS2-4 TaxID=2987703 RepID=UPI00227C8C93|nr:HAMP domain-containing sensor histidine kinase [Clostridium sp. ZS2-4]MCY6355915.1 HAMP domain-containing sensor histidine kinase [Clostridium sp. ZS2-4]
MAKKYIIERLSLKKQFIVTILMVLFFSFICTVIGFVMNIKLISTGNILRADYYESKMKEIEDYVKNYSDKIVNKDFKSYLNKVIPLQGIEYEVIDSKGEFVYGEYNNPIIDTPIKLVSSKKIENHGFLGQEVIAYLPINYSYKLQGMIVFKYYLRNSAKNPKYNFIVKYSDIISIILPFIYIITFTLIFSTRLCKRLNKPLNELREGAQKIKDKDLDFNISYESSNELGMVCKSFENMRVELKNTLEKQWRIEEERKEMVGAIAHDLRTPITIIKGHVEGLMDAKKLDEVRLYKYLNLINKNTDRMIKLVGDMNTLTKIETSDFQPEYTKCDIVKFIEEKSIDYRILARDKEIKFSSLIEDI